MKLFVRLGLLLSVMAGGTNYARATGYFGPTVYLDEGGRKLTASPEFYWQLEVKRLAREFHPPEKRTGVKFDESQPNDARKAILDRATAEADEHDFATALQEHRLNASDPAEASRQHQAARDAIGKANPAVTEPL